MATTQIRMNDECDTILVVESNHAHDKGMYLSNAKNMSEPLYLGIEEPDGMESGYGLSLDQAKVLVRGISSMIDYLEEE